MIKNFRFVRSQWPWERTQIWKIHFWFETETVHDIETSQKVNQNFEIDSVKYPLMRTKYTTFLYMVPLYTPKTMTPCSAS